MNFSALSGCSFKVRLAYLRAFPVQKATAGFVYNAMLNSSYKSIIESQMPVDAKILFDMGGEKIAFEYKGFKESVHAVAVIDGVPHLVKVIIVNEPVIEETLDIKYKSVKSGLQAIMNHSDLGGRPKINKSIVLAVNTEDFSVIKIFINADEVAQQNMDMKIDNTLDLGTRVEAIKNDDCKTCPYNPICQNDELPVVSCSTCAFYRVNESTCSIGNSQVMRCPQHLYNPMLLPNHQHIKADPQNLFIEYNSFVNSNNPVAGKVALTSDEMLVGHKFDKERILDESIHMFVKDFGGRIVNFNKKT